MIPIPSALRYTLVRLATDLPARLQVAVLGSKNRKSMLGEARTGEERMKCRAPGVKYARNDAED